MTKLERELTELLARMREELIDELRAEGWLAPSDMWEVEYTDGTAVSPPWTLVEDRGVA